ncbi:hypothetical protein LTR08_005910 [Meristemomyces frigidus]|nr:hypothetical protein LTR08_005910 [Meristemomyces frigidus]
MDRVNSLLTDGHHDTGGDSGLFEDTQGPLVLGSWGRRMSKRYVAETDYRIERAGKQRHTVIYDGIMESAGEPNQESIGVDTAGLSASGGGQINRRKSMLNSMRLFKTKAISEGDQIMGAPEPKSLATIKAKPVHDEGGCCMGRLSKFTEHTTTSPGENEMDEQEEALKLVQEQRQLSEPTDLFKVLMLGEKQDTDVSRSASMSSPTKAPLGRTLSKLLFNPPKKLTIAGPRVLGLRLSPEKDKSPGDTKPVPILARSPSVHVGGTRFEMISPPPRAFRSPLLTIVQPPKSIPPQSASKNFSTLPQKLTEFYLLLCLPKKLRKKIFALVIVAKHEILVCTCGFCSFTNGCKQPAVTQVSQQLRREALPIFYGENKFVFRGSYSWQDNGKVPVWLRAMSQPTRDLIRHIEVCTADTANAVCMMAMMGFRMSHRLTKLQSSNLGMALNSGKICMTFAAKCPPAEEVDEEFPVAVAEKKVSEEAVEEFQLPTIRKVSSIHLWDCEGNVAESWKIGVPEEPEAKKSFELLNEVDDSTSLCSSVCTVGTSILDLSAVEEDILARGDVARSARKRVAVTQQDSEEVLVKKKARLSKEIDGQIEELDSIGNLIFREDDDFTEPCAEVRSKQRYSVGMDIVRASSGSFA